ncbi:hypothetical protein HAX54_005385, partial [Datura stramonium]|nr:hypothetical protein [Datura stramonium]
KLELLVIRGLLQRGEFYWSKIVTTVRGSLQWTRRVTIGSAVTVSWPLKWVPCSRNMTATAKDRRHQVGFKRDSKGLSHYSKARIIRI